MFHCHGPGDPLLQGPGLGSSPCCGSGETYSLLSDQGLDSSWTTDLPSAPLHTMGRLLPEEKPDSGRAHLRLGPHLQLQL